MHDFKCQTCDCEFEFLKLKSEETVQCPQCGEDKPEKLEQQISQGTSHQFKSGKWFKDGY